MRRWTTDGNFLMCIFDTGLCASPPVLALYHGIEGFVSPWGFVLVAPQERRGFRCIAVTFGTVVRVALSLPLFVSRGQSTCCQSTCCPSHALSIPIQASLS